MGMGMAANKTRPTKVRVSDFLNAVEDPQRQSDAKKVAAMMRRVTGKQGTMWGPAIVGYGEYHYRYDSGREGDFMMVGFSPRKQNLALYIMPGFEAFPELMKNLGKYKTGKSCLYINKLDDVDEKVLEKLVSESFKLMKKKYGAK